MKRTRKQPCQYSRLEDRRLLASFAFYPDNVQLKSFAADQVLSIFEQGEMVAFYLPEGDTWHGTDVPGSIEGNGTSQLNIHPDLFVGRSLHVTDDTETMDTVFASDLELGIFLSGDTISQSAGTTLNLRGGLYANSVALREPGNQLNVSIHSTHVDVFSDNAIEIHDLAASYGSVRSADSLFVGTSNPGFSLLQVDVTVTLAAPTLDIRSARLGVAGQLNLHGTESIHFVSNNVNPGDGSAFGPFVGHSELNQLNFQSHGDVHISIDEVPGEFDYPRNGEVFLVGDNRARNLSLDVGFKKLFDVPTATLQVQGNAFLGATGTIFMADHPGNLLWIERLAHFEVGTYAPYFGPGIPSGIEILGNLQISSQGDVRLGWIRSNHTTFVSIVEDDSSYLARIGDAARQGEKFATRAITIHSPGDITIAPTGELVSEFVTKLYADGKVTSAEGTDQGIDTSVLELMGAEIDLDQLDVDQVNFSSTGDVSIQADSSLFLRGENQGQDLTFLVNGQLGNIAGTTVLGYTLDVTADSIWLANASTSDRLRIYGQSVFHAPDAQQFAVIGRQGQVELGSVTFDVFRMELHETDNLFLVGNNVAQTLVLSTNDYIFDGPGTRLEVAHNATFTTPSGVFLSDHESDFTSLCGHTVFDVGDFAIVSSAGTVTMNTWEVLNGAIQMIEPDFQC